MSDQGISGFSSKRNRWRLPLLVVVVVGACSYINEKGDADKFAEDFKATHLAGAKSATHTCQSRDTDGNDYVSCTVTVDWGVEGDHPEIIPIECAVNRTGSGCNVEGCRPLTVFGGRKGNRQ